MKEHRIQELKLHEQITRKKVLCKNHGRSAGILVFSLLVIMTSLLLCACGKDKPKENTDISGTPTEPAATMIPEVEREFSEEIIRSLTNQGNATRLQKFINKAKAGEPVTIACIGGSITEGYKVNKNECYASLLQQYVAAEYANSSVKLVNAGISGTPSNIGLMRLDTDVLSKQPDLIVVEFAVNDSQDVLTKMMFDSLVNDCLMSSPDTAVIILLTVTETGYTCEQQMTVVGKAYDLPVINVKSAIWPEITAGNMKYSDYSGDEAHPNAAGHKRILSYFDYLFYQASRAEVKSEPDYNTVHGFAPNYKGMKLYTADVLEPDSLGGFKAQASSVGNFSEGWGWQKGSQEGAFTFNFNGKDLFLLFITKNSAKYGKIEVLIDGKQVATVDSNDPAGFGGVDFKRLFSDTEVGRHYVEIRMAEDSQDKNFQIVGLATTGEIEGGQLGAEEKTYQERAVLSMGNTERLLKLFERAKAGEELTIGFIGGSITMGSGSSNYSKSYARLVFDWFVKTFPEAKFKYVNAGIGATTSQFACARLQEDLLSCEPDFVIIEFSVNDESGADFKDSYESLVRTVLTSPSAPATVILNMVQYDSGMNVQMMHNQVAKYYKLPIISMKDSIYREIVKGKLKASDISADNLHPNDRGHAYAAEIVTCYLEKILAEKPDTGTYEIPSETLTEVIYTGAVRYNNKNSTPELNGFTADTSKQNDITDVFKNGFTARKTDASISFTVQGQKLLLQYRKSNTMGAPKAKVIIDGNEDAAIVIDGNFESGWGNWLYLQEIYTGTEKTSHTVEIRIIEAGEKQDFYLVSVIAL